MCSKKEERKKGRKRTSNLLKWLQGGSQRFGKFAASGEN